jgi:hypothetical protein
LLGNARQGHTFTGERAKVIFKRAHSLTKVALSYLLTLPARIQDVQARIVRVAPLMTARTRRRLGSHRRLVTLWA